MKKFIEEFKTFIRRGNVMELAIGIIIGGAFQKIVTSLVADIITPLLGLFGSTSFEALTLKLGSAEIKYGAFITSIIDFLIMAFIIFLLVKVINKVSELGKKPKSKKEETTKKCPYCCSTIDKDASRCPNCTSQLDSLAQ